MRALQARIHPPPGGQFRAASAHPPLTRLTRLTRMQERTVRTIGWIASFAAILMFFSYIDQIRLNLDGHKGSVVQAVATVINCTLWTTYGLGRPAKDWPIIMANIPGIVLGVVAAVTAW